MDKFYAILDEDNLVINCVIWPVDQDINDLLVAQYSEKYRAKEYSMNGRITNNPAGIGLYYREDLNAFIVRSPGPEYTLNAETYQWELIQEN
jgi:hypothetical protein